MRVCRFSFGSERRFIFIFESTLVYWISALYLSTTTAACAVKVRGDAVLIYNLDDSSARNTDSDILIEAVKPANDDVLRHTAGVRKLHWWRRRRLRCAKGAQWLVLQRTGVHQCAPSTGQPRSSPESQARQAWCHPSRCTTRLINVSCYAQFLVDAHGSLSGHFPIQFGVITGIENNSD